MDYDLITSQDPRDGQDAALEAGYRKPIQACARWWFHPAFVSSILSLICLPLGDSAPKPGVDASWELGLSLVHVHNIAAGPGFVFTYGPLGFLAEPNIVWLPGAILGLVYVLGATFAFYFLISRALLKWLSPIAAVAITALFALAIVPVGTDVGTVPELATAAVILWALTLIRPSALAAMLPDWVAPVLGVVAAMQLLVKFSTGLVVLGVAIIVALSRPPKLRNAGLVAGSFLASVVTLWLVAQQSLANLVQWFGRSIQIAAGYSEGQALSGGADGNRAWLFWLIAVGVLLIAVVLFVRQYQARAIPSAALVVLGAWFFTKEGMTRLDSYHVNIAYFGLAVLIAAFLWQRGWIPVAVLGLAVALGAIIAGSGFSPIDSRLGSLGTQARQGVVEAGRIVRSTVDASYRSDELDRAAADIRASDRVSNTVSKALHGARVHADPTEIAAVWAFGLEWRPAPVFQTYQANTASLDRANADSLRNRDGPNAVLREVHADSLGRIPAWESPNYMVTLTCSYRLAAESPGWQALLRTSDTCARPRLLSEKVLRSNQAALVPTARNRSDIVVATFDYPTSPAERLLTALLKPFRYPEVRADGQTSSFVTGTASNFHLVHVPENIANRRVTNAGLDIRSIAFPDAPGSVIVRFYELHTDDD